MAIAGRLMPSHYLDEDPRLTMAEWLAVRTALAQCLAGPLDGFDEPEGDYVHSQMQNALDKIHALVRR